MVPLVTDAVINFDLQVLPPQLSIIPSLRMKLCLIVAPSHSINFNNNLFFMKKIMAAGGRLILCNVQHCSCRSCQHIYIHFCACWHKLKRFNKSFVCCFLWSEHFNGLETHKEYQKNKVCHKKKQKNNCPSGIVGEEPLQLPFIIFICGCSG